MPYGFLIHWVTRDNLINASFRFSPCEERTFRANHCNVDCHDDPRCGGIAIKPVKPILRVFVHSKRLGIN